MSAAPLQVAIVGAGWAGLAAAVELARAGAQRVAVFDAAPQPGGRARAVRWRLGGEEVELDNGQHLLVGAYRECLRLVRLVTGDETSVLRRERLCLEDVDGLRLRAWPLPAPLHLAAALLGARGLAPGERLACLRLVARARAGESDIPPGTTAGDWLDECGQPARLRQRLWDPLCLAALNTPAEAACARTFARVLRDTLAAEARASDFVAPRATLSDVFPRPAERWLAQRGIPLRTRSLVRALRPSGAGWVLDAGDTLWQTDRVVLAVPPFAAARLLEPFLAPGPGAPLAAAEGASVAAEGAWRPESLLGALRAFDYDSIATVWLTWRRGTVALPAWTMLHESAPQGWHGQWLFDRGDHGGQRVAGVVVSARGRAAAADVEALAEGIAAQVQAQLHVAPPVDRRVVVEKRATFRCLPGRAPITPQAPGLAARGDPGSPLQRTFLAGDYAYPGYPATLEAAVRSGVVAARLALGRG